MPYETSCQLERELKASQEAYLQSIERDDYLTQALAEADERAEKAEAEIERLKGMVMEAARKGDELLEPCRLRVEKAETLIKQIHAFVEALNRTDK